VAFLFLFSISRNPFSFFPPVFSRFLRFFTLYIFTYFDCLHILHYTRLLDTARFYFPTYIIINYTHILTNRLLAFFFLSFPVLLLLFIHVFLFYYYNSSWLLMCDGKVFACFSFFFFFLLFFFFFSVNIRKFYNEKKNSSYIVRF
jgi:hypothetical protein